MLTGKQVKIYMPKGPQNQRRSADTNAAAVMVGEIATGEIEDATTDDGKSAAAVVLGRMGGKARAASISARRRKQIARQAAEKRWKKAGKE